MPDLSFAAIVQRQIRLLQQVCDTLTSRALAGQRADLDSLFLAQDHLEHWLQYLSPLAVEAAEHALDAPAPLVGMRPAPPLPHEAEHYARDFADVEDATLRPRVTFPPEPVWVEDLEREQGERES